MLGIVSIEELASESTDEKDQELISNFDMAEESLASLEASGSAVISYVATEDFSIGMEERGFLRRIGGDIADHYKMLFAWADGNGAKIRRNRELIRTARSKLRDFNGRDSVIGNSLITYLGNHAHYIKDVSGLVKLVKQDAEHTQKILVPMIQATGAFSKELVEWIYSKDNDWKWGYDEAVEGTLPIFQHYIPKMNAAVKDYKVEGYDHNDLRVEDGSRFSILFLGNYAISNSWGDAYEQAKHLTPSEALMTYTQSGGHDFVKVPKRGNKFGLDGSVTRKDLEELLHAADIYLDAADAAAKSIKANAMPIFKMLMASNIIGGNASMLIKMMGSKNYQALYGAMWASRNWAMKLQRKSATRNQDIAKHLAEFVQSNLR